MKDEVMFNIVKKHLFVIALVCSYLFPSLAFSAVRPQLTRIIAYTSTKEMSVDIINESNEAYMVQSWLEDLNGNESNVPLVLTPPVMRLNGNSEGKLRLVVLPGEIPQDRESVYWLSLQEIPPKAKGDIESKLVIAIRSRLKVFVRPKGLTEKEAAQAVTKLAWEVEREDGKVWLKAVNPTPYYISFGKFELKAGNETITPDDKVKMPPPMGSQRYEVPKSMIGKSVTLTYNSVNDFGGAGEDITASLVL
jgi:P pilus assembly chaperone PapD